jgi:hypothetical protein
MGIETANTIPFQVSPFFRYVLSFIMVKIPGYVLCTVGRLQTFEEPRNGFFRRRNTPYIHKPDFPMTK